MNTAVKEKKSFDIQVEQLKRKREAPQDTKCTSELFITL